MFQKTDGQFVQHLPAPQLGDLMVEHGIALLHRGCADQLPAFFQRELCRPQFPAQVEPPGISDCIVTIAGILVDLGVDQAHFFVVAQSMGCDTKQRCHLTDGIAHNSKLLSGQQNLRAARMLFFYPSLLYRIRAPFQVKKLCRSLPENTGQQKQGVDLDAVTGRE